MQISMYKRKQDYSLVVRVMTVVVIVAEVQSLMTYLGIKNDQSNYQFMKIVFKL